MKAKNWGPHELRRVNDVLLNGVSVLAQGVQEAYVTDLPGERSWVLLEKRLPEDVITRHNRIVDGEPTIDGQVLTIAYHGDVEVIE